MNTAIFVVGIIGLLTVSYVLYVSFAARRAHVEPSVPRRKCSVSFAGERLTPCTDDGDCKFCENTSCTTVSDAEPYRYRMGEETMKVPNGKWCLQPRVEDMPCNEMTGFRVLTRNPHFSNYAWECHCKNPKTVRNAGVYGDCIEVVACGAGDLVCPPGSTDCTPGEKWSETSKWNPEAGVCNCPEGLKFVVHEGRKLCEEDDCFPGKVKAGGDGCDCPAPELINNEWKSTINIGNQCVPDPCNPSGHMQGGRCVCRPGSIPYEDSLSPTGWICKSPCDPKDNPCLSKGKCIFDQEGHVKCTDCRYPNYQSDDGLCNNIVKHGNVQCENDSECEILICDKMYAPIWNFGDGHKYCAPY